MIGDWSFALLTMLVVLALPGVGGHDDARGGADRRTRSRSGSARPGEVPELRGLDAPLTTDQRLELDAALGLERAHA